MLKKCVPEYVLPKAQSFTQALKRGAKKKLYQTASEWFKT